MSPNSYSFHANNVITISSCALFTMTENINGNTISSAGVSCFLVTAISTYHLTTCSIIYHFNGNYLVICPLYEFCVSTKDEEFYGNLGAYYDRQCTLLVPFSERKRYNLLLVIHFFVNT